MKKLFVIHPFLFAIFPILFLFAHNINQVRFSEALSSLIITVVISGFLLLLLRLIFTNTLKAGIMVSVFWVLFFSYGHVYEIIKHWVIGGIELGQNEYLLPIYGTLLIGSAYFIYRTGKKLYNLSSILNVIAVSLVAISLINIGTYKFIHLKRYKTTYKADIDITTEVTRRQVTVYPDIYCIILDEYAGLNQIKKVYNYDNNKFSNRLIEKGFYVAKKSRTKIPTTPQTLVALLNMRFPKESENPYEMIRNNEVTQFLKSKGYKYIHFGSWWSATIRSQYADFNFNNWLFENEFFIVLASTSMLRPLFYSGTLSGRSRVLYTFDRLAKVPDMDIGAPKFVLAHIICPHPPFVFGPNGEKLGLKDRTNWNNKSLYLGQYIFITKKIEELVDLILSKSKNPPIIIIQSDHSVRKHSDFDVGDSREIFNAYYLPEGGSDLLYDSITPVNTFRLIFNFYFNTAYELLGDRSYFSPYLEPDTFIDVTD